MPEADYRLMTEATGQRIAAALENLSGFGDYLTTADVVNNLTSTAANKPLSANMGKALDGYMTVINNKKLNMLHKTTDAGKTFTITFTEGGRSALIYGRFGYDWSLLSMAVIGHQTSDMATIKCFGDQVATVSCSGHVVTVTTANAYANVTIISDDNIS